MRFALSTLLFVSFFATTASAQSELKVVPDLASVPVGVANGTNYCGGKCAPIDAQVVGSTVVVKLLVAPDLGCVFGFDKLTSVSVHLSPAKGMGQEWRFSAPGSLNCAGAMDAPRPLTLKFGGLPQGGLKLHKVDGTSVLLTTVKESSKVQMKDLE